MMHTLRDSLVERLIAEFGVPWRIGNNFRWSIEREHHAPVNISLDSWRTPTQMAVWVFDPSKAGPASAWYATVEQPEDIETFIRQVRHDLTKST